VFQTFQTFDTFFQTISRTLEKCLNCLGAAADDGGAAGAGCYIWASARRCACACRRRRACAERAVARIMRVRVHPRGRAHGFAHEHFHRRAHVFPARRRARAVTLFGSASLRTSVPVLEPVGSSIGVGLVH
jgi:hypothetical protein